MEREVIQIEPIELEWSDWHPWDALRADARSGGVRVPNKQPGVYEAKYRDGQERLTIGKASDLRMRLRQGLIKGKVPHVAGERIRQNENTDLIDIRWAITHRPAAVEEELQRGTDRHSVPYQSM